jgi:peptidoglycan hydrolase-like protein with peptidoglycan-binding domain
MVNPAPGYKVTTPFGKPGSWAAGFHTGEDRACPTGAKIVAAEAGTVVYSGNGGGWGSAYGVQVIIDTNGRRHAYCHLKSRTVGYGQRVKRGQTIGYADSTGRSFGPHLHYEERTGAFRYGTDSKRPIFPAYGSGSTGGGGTTSPTVCLGDYCYGKNKPAHKALQRRLKEKGHDPGYGDWPTDYYGDGTKKAMAAFQKKQGWSGSDADGMPGPGTLDKLGLPQRLSYRSNKRVYLSKMKKGQGDSDSVWNVQVALLRKGYSIPAGPTDYFGDQTIKAVQAFQKKQGWTGSDADGIPGPGTVKALGLQYVDDRDEPDTTTPPPPPPPSVEAPKAPERIPPGVQWRPIQKKDGTWVTGLRKFSTGGKPKIVLHTVEGGMPNWTNLGSGYPHFTVDLDKNDLRMHIPLDMAAYTLKGGTHSPNSAGGVTIQIEIVGYAKDTAGWSQDKCDRLKALLLWIASQIGAPYTFPLPFTDDAGYGIGGEVRVDWDRWQLTTGIVGHSHAPYNDHWDPGDVPVEKLIDKEPDPDPDPDPDPEPGVLYEGPGYVRVYTSKPEESA